MLDTETKRRIDTARDILVGKVPDPKSQVEQITIALIYKFMDDMDLEAEELGGNPAFFTGDYEKYGWRKIFDPALGGHEMLGLYGDAITRMALNPNLPQLFRDIFKNAYLPYRDPETLKSFLKIIDDFNYDHSEKLGDAFEYLLSVLGSQGDAGQFRTPRHIIDFMTALLDPKKNETVVDPACGTAGFLISAYKHILKENSANYDPEQDRHAFDLHGIKLDELTVGAGKRYKGDKLTPDDRNRLTASVKGYDISPDMVRLSLVNLYLHGFPAPQVYEYDTLTSDERWNEFYDVILANPPFMSPKGGIRPHKRFSVMSNRSEVLFVDYMAEHLTTNGRAAIVVPEGVIFQSGTAYKSLRKMLVDENYLVGVISLPAGVFNPYSGVKTSILWLDKALAKKTQNVLFAKIGADGFDLGAQRRPIKQNDLPHIFRQLTAYKTDIANGQTPGFDNEPNLSIVDKELIGEKGEYSLSGERYRQENIVKSSDYKFVKLGDVCDFVRGPFGGSLKKEIFTEDGYAVYEQQHAIYNQFDKIRYFIDEDKFQEMKRFELLPGDIIMSCSGTMGKIAIVPSNIKRGVINQALLKLSPNESIKVDLLKYWMESESFQNAISSNVNGAAIQNVASVKILQQIKIPLPPLTIQEEIVAEIEGYQKIIDGARQVVTHYKPRITIDPDWEMVALGEVCEHITKGTTPTTNGFKFQDSGIIFVKIENINSDGSISHKKLSFIDKECHESLKRSQLQENDILFSIAGTKMGISGLVDSTIVPANTNQALAIIRAKSNCDPRFLLHYLRSDVIQNEIEKIKIGVAQFNLSLKQVAELTIPLPLLEIQHQIVTQIEREQALVKANAELITIFEQKIKDRIAKVWGE